MFCSWHFSCSCLAIITMSTVPCSLQKRIDSPVRVLIQDGCWDDSEGLWLGPCLKLKVRRFCDDYCMPIGSLSTCKYGWWRHPWSPAVVVLSSVSAEWGSEAYLSALIHPPYRFLQELCQIRVLCHWIIDG